MADYSTHRNIGIIASIGATAVLFTSTTAINTLINLKVDTNISTISLIIMVIAGVIGSIFPDIDLKTSRPSKFMRIFLMLAISMLSFTILEKYNKEILNIINFSTEYIVFVNTAIAVVISFITIKIIENIMEHRGIVHSVPFAIISAIILFESVNFIKTSYNFENLNSLMIAILFFIGFIVHLILDEMFSVDLLGARIKKSFGTALKIVDRKNLIGTAIIYTIIVVYVIEKNIF
jgi:hypothetical protein